MTNEVFVDFRDGIDLYFIYFEDGFDSSMNGWDEAYGNGFSYLRFHIFFDYLNDY